MKTAAVITARGGSKGIPGKNIADLAGKPLIAWGLEAALKSPSVDRLIVSTDDDKIAEACRKYGADVPFKRPDELSGDKSPHIPVVQHAVQWLEDNEKIVYDYIMLIQPTSPFVVSEDIEAALKLAVDSDADAVSSVCEAEKHPAYALTLNEKGILERYIKRDSNAYFRRQDLKTAYIENGAIYIVKRDVLMNESELDPVGRTRAYIMSAERSVDIDSPWDLYVANLIMRDRMNSAS
jgi:CMP-N-acetylneuraminic acid synthetase